MKFVLGTLILILCYLMGVLIRNYFELPVPAAVIGMCLLLFLQAVFKSQWQLLNDSLRSASEKLLPWLPLFIVPASVGVMLHLELLARHWWPLALALVISLIIGMVLTPFGMRRAIRWSAKTIHKQGR